MNTPGYHEAIHLVEDRIERRQAVRVNSSGRERCQCRVPQRLANQSLALPTPGGNKDPSSGHNDSPKPAELLAEEQIFHERQEREAAQLLKLLATNKQPLITVGQPGEADSCRRTGSDATKQPAAGTHAHGITARDIGSPIQKLLGFLHSAVLQETVCMQEHERLCGRTRSPQVHLQSAAAGAPENDISLVRQTKRGVAAAAVYDDNLVRTQLTHTLQRLRQAAFFIQSRYDNRNAQQGILLATGREVACPNPGIKTVCVSVARAAAIVAPESPAMSG